MRIEETPQFQEISLALSKANLCVANKVDAEALVEMAILFAEILSDWSPKTIEMAFTEHLRRSKFMPTPSEILENCRSCSQSLEYHRQKHEAIPMPDCLPEKVRQENIKRIHELKQRVFGDI